MNGFSEAWLREYQSKRAAVVSNAPVIDQIEFTLPRRLHTLNRLFRMSHFERTAYRRSLSAEMANRLPRMARPMQCASVVIVRYDIQIPDHDGAVGSVKPLVDCLLVRSDRHPDGLGILVDDSPDHINLVVRSERAESRASQRTHVTITRAER